MKLDKEDKRYIEWKFFMIMAISMITVIAAIGLTTENIEITSVQGIIWWWGYMLGTIILYGIPYFIAYFILGKVLDFIYSRFWKKKDNTDPTDEDLKLLKSKR